jgi:CRISPR-associated protein Csm1
VRINDAVLSRAARWPASFRYLAIYVTRVEAGDPKPFDKIAGNGLLGVVKADVDNLGLVFREGLRRDQPQVGLDTASRVAALSRQMDWFFSGWMEWLISTNFSDCYTVYSGGDDLLLVGPRKRILELAEKIRSSFDLYTQNTDITLSAGIAVVKPKLPLAHTANQAERALNKAKISGRNSLSILGDVLPWAEYDSIRDEIKGLSEIQTTSSFLYHLLYCGDLWRRYARDNDLLGLRYHPLLAYQMARNIDPKKQAKLYKWARRLLATPVQGKAEQLLNHLQLIVQWVLLERREK